VKRHFQNNYVIRLAWGPRDIAQVVEHLSSKYRALS
jgi:hypothetical protein